ncbi:hypothetical protein A2955_02490 [Candidatus Woesebacteria bacterium RIFCSPLOWO2_01_FULL_37_19]|uniref:ABC transporter permease n=2 Tax=Candidatus Woeseibacteriota TaxID=1752722 RepID=A0A1F8B5V7_9BACT|nr:MAG: hypothetical protein A2771_01290 [Candidatus Woesebacteria bacterium RIFCSPHIGHO2_01_FULL_38_26b]OGM59416.1 MAG: hypothetical protein A2955_02490 [Candidatus Woesebacteria bacterium RIFCSPLOWO2_01_FULL_37_19]
MKISNIKNQNAKIFNKYDYEFLSKFFKSVTTYILFVNRRFIYYFKLWLFMSKNAFLVYILDRFSFSIFLFGKVMRFLMYFVFLYFLVKGTKTLAGYNVNQTIFFFLTFNVIDILAQFLYREAYRFRSLIISGGFDLVLAKPVNPLFRSLLGGADLIDLVTIPPLFVATYYVGSLLNPTFINAILYLLLLINGFIIATSFYIAVLALGIVTLEIDHTIMIYRDMIALGRLPLDIYKEPVRSILTFLVPVGVMISYPAKAMIGLISIQGIIVSFGLAGISMFLSIRLWKFALKKYTSASS